MLLITGGWQPPNTSAHALVVDSEVWLFRSRLMQAFGNKITGLWQQLPLWQKRPRQPAASLIGCCSQWGAVKWRKTKLIPAAATADNNWEQRIFLLNMEGGMKKRKENEMAFFFFTGKDLMVSFLSPLAIKWDKTTQKENSTDFYSSCKKRQRSRSSFLTLSFQKGSRFPFLWLLIAAFFWLQQPNRLIAEPLLFQLLLIDSQVCVSHSVQPPSQEQICSSWRWK